MAPSQAVAPELAECHQCANRGFNCELRPGKSTLCMPCIEVKVKCVHPGAEKPETKHWRKHTDDEEEELQKPRKKARPSGGSNSLEGGSAGLDPDFQRLFKGPLGHLDHQNQLLVQLVELKTAEVYRGKESEPEEEFEEGREEEVAVEILDL
ncbi:hypothetical protein V8E55_008500 [Tylopilus felleus]